jgi:hypothetical protein
VTTVKNSDHHEAGEYLRGGALHTGIIPGVLRLVPITASVVSSGVQMACLDGKGYPMNHPP